MKATPDGFPDATTGHETAGLFADNPDLNRVVEQYLAALERGEQPSRKDLLARHPEIADLLVQCFDALDFIDCAAPRLNLPRDSSEPAEAALAPGVLGDYRILREVGRGGMGVVYEAEQILLKRRVALKVLPFAAVLDRQRLKRFHNEAQAAASLRHPNIVQVFAVGCERAVHFFVMDYVEGQTLADVIKQLRANALPPSERDGDTSAVSRLAQGLTSGTLPVVHAERSALTEEQQSSSVVPPAVSTADTESELQAAISTEGSNHSQTFFRSVAQLGIQAADALEHAHQVGVVHRDIKPSNLMVESDGHLWLTDFGLATTQSDTNLTMAGDLLGTLRYMSPEQIEAKHGVSDHRTDIYSLGVTLYELLTLRPAFAGESRRELMRKIVDDAPPLPRHLNRAIPKDLETIVLKATAKDLMDRYATARELADDLRCYLEDKPIAACRPSVVSRAAKWLYRNRPLVITAIITCMLSLAATSGFLWQAAKSTKVKNQQLQKEQARTAEALAESDANWQLARQAVDDMYTRVVEKLLTDQPRTTPLQKEFLEKALAFYENLPDRLNGKPGLRFEAARAHHRAGNIYRLLGNYSRAQEQLEMSIREYQRICQEHPENSQYSAELANALHRLGHVFKESDRGDLATPLWQKSMERISKLAASEPENVEFRQESANIHRCLGKSLADGDPEQAGELLREAVRLGQTLVDGFPEEAKDQINLCDALLDLSDLSETPAEQESLVRDALEISQRLVVKHPMNFGSRQSVGVAQAKLALILCGSGRMQEGLEASRGSVRTFESLARLYPNVFFVYALLSTSRSNLISALNDDGRPEEAEAEVRRAVNLARQRIQAQADSPLAHGQLGNWLIKLQQHLRAAGQRDEARDLLQEAIDEAGRMHSLVARDEPNDQRSLANLYLDLAHALLAIRRPNDVVEYAKRAAEIYTELGDHEKPVEAYILRGRAFGALGQPEKSASEFERAIELDSESPRALLLLAIGRAQRGKLESARAAYREFTQLPEMNDPQRQKLSSLRALAEFLLSGKHDDKEKAPEDN